LSILPSLSKDVVLHCPACLRERGEMICYAPRQRHCAVCQFEALEPLELGRYGMARCTPEDVLRDPAASLWLKDTLRSALTRDPVDAANDAELLAHLLEERRRLILRGTTSLDAQSQPTTR
jgi:hypothetical protein